MSNEGNLKLEQIIMKISAMVGLAIGAMELVMFVMTDSQAILIDGLYDWMGVVISISYIFIQPLLYRPVSEKTPYGYAQLETVFVLVKCSVLICMTVYIIFENFNMLIAKDRSNEVDTGFIAKFELIVFAICFAAFLLLKYYSKKVASPMISAEMMEWKLDIYLTFGSFVGFSVVPLLRYFGIAFIADNIDQIIAIIISFFMIVQPIRMFRQSLKEIVLFAPDAEMVAKIKDIVGKDIAGYPYEVTFFDIVETGRKVWLSLYIRSVNGTYHIELIRELQEKLEASLTGEYEDIDIDLIPEIDEK